MFAAGLEGNLTVKIGAFKLQIISLAQTTEALQAKM
jgi:hypothetical protein